MAIKDVPMASMGRPPKTSTGTTKKPPPAPTMPVTRPTRKPSKRRCKGRLSAALTSLRASHFSSWHWHRCHFGGPEEAADGPIHVSFEEANDMATAPTTTSDMAMALQRTYKT